MKKTLLTLFGLIMVGLSFGNNILVSNVTLVGQNTSAGLNNSANFTFVQFNLTWDNSWRVAPNPANWDAAWIFVKYQITGGGTCTPSATWKHATLSSALGQTAPAGATIDGTNGVGTASGVFIYRNAVGSGSNNFPNVQLRWNYGLDGVLDACSVTIKVFAIEMVYVPGSTNFYLGDGVIGAGGAGRFEASPYGAGNQFLVNAANVPSTLGGGGAGSLGNNNNAGQATADDFNTVTSVSFTASLTAGYPNGYTKFYSMKYEITQEQYAEFLNTLLGTQQSARTPATTVGWFHANAGNITTPQNRNGIKCKTAPSGPTAGEYVCDLNNNGVFNEVNGDGRYIACNFLSAPDLLAYLDWSGLRPMSEFEFEKSCRGIMLPVISEFAWGSAAATAAVAISNGGADSETSTTANANIVYNNQTSGPLRAGIFATGSTTRIQAGASYYGIMELSGNVWEDVVSPGSVAGRSFTGLHGNGTLNATGAADVDFWPGINNNGNPATANTAYGGVNGCINYAGIGFAGGTWNTIQWSQVSDRQYVTGWNGLSGRDNRNGGRGVRTAP